MSVDNPEITVSDIITDVEVRLGETNLDNSDYIAWISYGYQKLYHALTSAGQRAKEELFGAYQQITLVAGTAEYNLDDFVTRFGSDIKIEIKYGGTGDDWVKASRLPSLANWRNQNNVSASYRDKSRALYYRLGNKIGFIPTPPTTDSGTPYARIWYIKRPYQLDDVDDVIDIPYRFIHPLANYVHAKAIIAENEDFTQSRNVEQKFEQELLEVRALVANEFNEHDGTNAIQAPANAPIFRNPLRMF